MSAVSLLLLWYGSAKPYMCRSCQLAIWPYVLNTSSPFRILRTDTIFKHSCECREKKGHIIFLLYTHYIGLVNRMSTVRGFYSRVCIPDWRCDLTHGSTCPQWAPSWEDWGPSHPHPPHPGAPGNCRRNEMEWIMGLYSEPDSKLISTWRVSVALQKRQTLQLFHQNGQHTEERQILDR